VDGDFLVEQKLRRRQRTLGIHRQWIPGAKLAAAMVYRQVDLLYQIALVTAVQLGVMDFLQMVAAMN